ncbi:MAG: DUF3179 domain-containing protein [Candidatus Harrisonbacteria bacterium]|nr:DUF3179 domain-containing protein [Candidatus Harrisonbacteria bacterium]
MNSLKFITIILGVLIIVALGLLIWQLYFRNEFNLPYGGETKKEIILISEENQEIKKEIMITDGVKHSVPLEEILSGGPPKDGIPPIDNPKFISINEANDWLKEDEPGLAFSRNGVHRFYPYQILVWHEIVNDTVEGQRILISYCPLCLTGYVLDPLVKGERVEFGTSGKLWKSNLVMYDRKTESLWSQVLGEAIVGEMTGAKLKVLPADQMLYGNWKKEFSAGQVLSRDTGATRVYGFSPYGDYFSVTNIALSLAKPTDTRLPNDAFVFGIVINDKAKAYNVNSVKEKGVIEDIFENNKIILRYEKDLEVVRMFKKLPDGTEERINPISGFWFSWATAHPDTELLK